MNLFVFQNLPFGKKPMNRLNGPYSYERHADDAWVVLDKNHSHISTCLSSYYAQMVAAALTDNWKRQSAAIEAAERVERE